MSSSAKPQPGTLAAALACAAILSSLSDAAKRTGDVQVLGEIVSVALAELAAAMTPCEDCGAPGAADAADVKTVLDDYVLRLPGTADPSGTVVSDGANTADTSTQGA